jgi:hypothetical protein
MDPINLLEVNGAISENTALIHFTNIVLLIIKKIFHSLSISNPEVTVVSTKNSQLLVMQTSPLL